MIYVASDIHGNYDIYEKLLNKINLTEKDALIILGDILDRGDDGIKIMLDVMQRDNIFTILNRIYKHKVEIKFLPNLYDILIGGVRINTIYATPLVSVSESSMPYWQQNTKRVMDIVFSCLFFQALFTVKHSGNLPRLPLADGNFRLPGESCFTHT